MGNSITPQKRTPPFYGTMVPKCPKYVVSNPLLKHGFMGSVWYEYGNGLVYLRFLLSVWVLPFLYRARRSSDCSQTSHKVEKNRSLTHLWYFLAGHTKARPKHLLHTLLLTNMYIPTLLCRQIGCTWSTWSLFSLLRRPDEGETPHFQTKPNQYFIGSTWLSSPFPSVSPSNDGEIPCFVGKTMPFAPSPSHHHFIGGM